MARLRRRATGTRTPLDSTTWHSSLRARVSSRTGHFPTDEAATKLRYLALRNILGKWQRGAHVWQAALPHFGMLFRDRFTQHS
jgi:transposase-like protein